MSFLTPMFTARDHGIVYTELNVAKIVQYTMCVAVRIVYSVQLYLRGHSWLKVSRVGTPPPNNNDGDL